MAAEAVALLKEFYSTGNPKGAQQHSPACACMSPGPSCDISHGCAKPMHQSLAFLGATCGSADYTDCAVYDDNKEERHFCMLGFGHARAASRPTQANTICCHAAPKPHRPLKQADAGKAPEM